MKDTPSTSTTTTTTTSHALVVVVVVIDESRIRRRRRGDRRDATNERPTDDDDARAIASRASFASMDALANGARFGTFAPRARERVHARARGRRHATMTRVRAMTHDVDVVVVGAGVSGLSTAFALKQQSATTRTLVTEGRENVGGNITSRNDGTYVWEEGPNSYQPGDAILKLACDAGMREDILLADPASNRYVLWDGKLRILPHSIDSAVLGDFLTWPGKIRAGLGAIGIRPPAPEGKEESVKEFVSRNLGTEAFERLIEPFCSGVYAGDPAMLSSVAATGRVQRLEPLGGSLVAGAIKAQKEAAANKKPRDPRLPVVKGQTVGSFRGGLKTFPEGLAKKLGEDVVKCKWKLTSVSKASDGSGYECAYDTPQGPQMVHAKCVLLTTPAYVAADVVKGISPKASKALNKFYYPPVASVTISYKKTSFRLDGTSALPDGGLTGFGQLHPRSQGIRTLGTIYSSSLFKDDKRQPDDEFMLLNYIGGARDVAIKDMTEAQLVEQVHNDCLKTVLKPGTPLPKVVGVRVWEKAIPQFNIGHLDILAEAKSALDEAKCGEANGMFLGGNYTAGVALGRCVEFGIEQADDVIAFLKTSSKATAAV